MRRGVGAYHAPHSPFLLARGTVFFARVGKLSRNATGFGLGPEALFNTMFDVAGTDGASPLVEDASEKDEGSQFQWWLCTPCSLAAYAAAMALPTLS